VPHLLDPEHPPDAIDGIVGRDSLGLVDEEEAIGHH
jgi:hypothetical protein